MVGLDGKSFIIPSIHVLASDRVIFCVKAIVLFLKLVKLCPQLFEVLLEECLYSIYLGDELADPLLYLTFD